MAETAQRAGDSALKWKVCVDTSAVLERSWAVLAGLGWLGKNTLLIHPRLGSYFFIGVVLINREIGHGPSPLPDYCGNCARCLEACPTKAFPEPHLLDATRCIAYLTLEKRGDLALDESARRGLGTWIAGCDVCQEVCPFNLKAAKSPIETPDRAIALDTWKELLEESPESYRERIKNSALSRVKSAQFSRNLAITLANAALPELAPLVRRRLERETDEPAKAEWRRCLAALTLQSPADH
jgi:epoxyqueuosine reductase